MAKELKQRKKGETEELKPAVAGTKTRSRQSPPKGTIPLFSFLMYFYFYTLFINYS